MAICPPRSGYSGTVELTLPSQKIVPIGTIPPIPDHQNLLFSVARGSRQEEKEAWTQTEPVRVSVCAMNSFARSEVFVILKCEVVTKKTPRDTEVLTAGK